MKNTNNNPLKQAFYFIFCFVLIACKSETKQPELPTTKKPVAIAVKHAKGFSIEKNDQMTLITVHSPWPNAEKGFTYALIDREMAAKVTFPKDAYDAVVLVPVEKIVVTSTTHIPSLEALGVEDKLIGFPSTQYISSEKTRKNVEAGKVKEIGSNETINTEVLIDLQPEVVVGFSIDSHNKTYNNIQKSGIAVVYNGDWTEQTPLGKAEWIKFFAPFFQKEKEADSLFSKIETDYLSAKELAKQAKTQPTVLSGSMYKDVWYLPAGDSYQAQFLKDANAQYLWNDSEGTGSLSLSFESVLEKGNAAQFWIAPGSFTSYESMKKANENYTLFDAFSKTKSIYTFSLTTGSTGGVLYYELAPNRPDIVLKDMIKILHPELLEDYEPYFFKPLQ